MLCWIADTIEINSKHKTECYVGDRSIVDDIGSRDQPRCLRNGKGYN